MQLKISRRDEESAIPVFMRSLIPSHCSLTRGHLGIGLLSPVCSPSQELMHEGEMSRLGKWGLIVPAKTADPSSSINRVNALASASVANILVSRARLRCLGRTPRLRSNVTYQVGVIAPPAPFSSTLVYADSGMTISHWLQPMKSRTWRATNLRTGCREGARDPQNSARLCARLAGPGR